MKWTVKLIAETRSGEPVEQEVATIERADVVSPATVGFGSVMHPAEEFRPSHPI